MHMDSGKKKCAFSWWLRLLYFQCSKCLFLRSVDSKKLSFRYTNPFLKQLSYHLRLISLKLSIVLFLIIIITEEQRTGRQLHEKPEQIQWYGLYHLLFKCNYSNYDSRKIRSLCSSREYENRIWIKLEKFGKTLRWSSKFLMFELCTVKIKIKSPAIIFRDVFSVKFYDYRSRNSELFCQFQNVKFTTKHKDEQVIFILTKTVKCV